MSNASFHYRGNRSRAGAIPTGYRADIFKGGENSASTTRTKEFKQLVKDSGKPGKQGGLDAQKTLFKEFAQLIVSGNGLKPSQQSKLARDVIKIGVQLIKHDSSIKSETATTLPGRDSKTLTFGETIEKMLEMTPRENDRGVFKKLENEYNSIEGSSSAIAEAGHMQPMREDEIVVDPSPVGFHPVHLYSLPAKMPDAQAPETVFRAVNEDVSHVEMPPDVVIDDPAMDSGSNDVVVSDAQPPKTGFHAVNAYSSSVEALPDVPIPDEPTGQSATRTRSAPGNLGPIDSTIVSEGPLPPLPISASSRDNTVRRTRSAPITTQGMYEYETRDGALNHTGPPGIGSTGMALYDTVDSSPVDSAATRAYERFVDQKDGFQGSPDIVDRDDAVDRNPPLPSNLSADGAAVQRHISRALSGSNVDFATNMYAEPDPDSTGDSAATSPYERFVDQKDGFPGAPDIVAPDAVYEEPSPLKLSEDGAATNIYAEPDLGSAGVEEDDQGYVTQAAIMRKRSGIDQSGADIDSTPNDGFARDESGYLITRKDSGSPPVIQTPPLYEEAKDEMYRGEQGKSVDMDAARAIQDELRASMSTRPAIDEVRSRESEF